MRQLFSVVVYIISSTFFSSSAFPAADDSPARIALLAVDTYESTTGALVDLLYVELSKAGKIQLVERGEIESLLHEKF